MLGIFNGQQGFVVAEQFTATHAPHVFTDVVHFQAWRKLNPRARIVKATCAHGRCVRGVDHRGETYDQIEREEKTMTTELDKHFGLNPRQATPPAPTMGTH